MNWSNRPKDKMFLEGGKATAILQGQEVAELDLHYRRDATGALHAWVNGVEVPISALEVTMDRAPAKGSPSPPGPRPRRVPAYYLQRDSLTAHSERMCFSSCVAMIVEDYAPGILSGPNGDDQYLARLLELGADADTTEAWCHRETLKRWKIASTWRQDLTLKDLDQRLEQGLLTSCGILHHGHLGNGLWGGHHILPYARTEKGYLCHDPYGELDMVRGVWVALGTSVATSPGKSVEYSRKNFEARWCPKGDGWGLLVEKP